MKHKIIYSKSRIAEAKRRLKTAFENKVCDQVPFIFNIDGFEAKESIGLAKIATNHDECLRYQIEMLNYQFSKFPDCERIPFFDMTDTGQDIIPSMFGAELLVTDLERPVIKNYLIENLADDIDKIPKTVNPYKDGWGPYCLKRLRYFLEATNYEIPCGYLDHQSSFGVATKLVKPTQLMIELYEHPELVTKLLDIVTEAIIVTVKAQKEIAGDLLIGSPYLPDDKNFIIWDDFVSVLSPQMYSKFCKPQNEKLYSIFCPGHLHTCGPVLDEPIKVMVATKNCVSVEISQSLRQQTKVHDDMLLLKDIVRGKCLCIGSLSEIYCPVPSEEEQKHSRDRITLDLVRKMNKNGGFIWIESGSFEEGERFLQWAREAAKHKGV